MCVCIFLDLIIAPIFAICTFSLGQVEGDVSTGLKASVTAMRDKISSKMDAMRVSICMLETEATMEDDLEVEMEMASEMEAGM